jgi:hypothetical protein
LNDADININTYDIASTNPIISEDIIAKDSIDNNLDKDNINKESIDNNLEVPKVREKKKSLIKKISTIFKK